jgi:hypothetical protein
MALCLKVGSKITVRSLKNALSMIHLIGKHLSFGRKMMKN